MPKAVGGAAQISPGNMYVKWKLCNVLGPNERVCPHTCPSRSVRRLRVLALYGFTGFMMLASMHLLCVSYVVCLFLRTSFDPHIYNLALHTASHLTVAGQGCSLCSVGDV